MPCSLTSEQRGINAGEWASGQVLSYWGAASGNLQEPEEQLQTSLAKGHLWEGRVGALFRVVPLSKAVFGARVHTPIPLDWPLARLRPQG